MSKEMGVQKHHHGLSLSCPQYPQHVLSATAHELEKNGLLRTGKVGVWLLQETSQGLEAGWMGYNVGIGPQIILIQRPRRSRHDLCEYVRHGVQHSLLDPLFQCMRKVNE